jgi:hypothetical protein
MYTPEMATAFHAIEAPKNFGVVLYDNDDYITLKIEIDELLSLTFEEQTAAAQYINDVKKALEGLGAIVLIVREAQEQ